MQTLKFTILNLQYSHLRVFALAVSLQNALALDITLSDFNQVSVQISLSSF